MQHGARALRRRNSRYSGPSAGVRVGSFLWRTGRFVLIARIPGRPAFEDPFGDPAPLGDLAVVSAHPVDRDRGQPALFAVAGEAKPAVAVFGGDCPTGPGSRPPVTEDTLFDQEYRVLNGGATLHSPPFDRRRMDHPDLPKAASGVEESAVAGVFGCLDLHVDACR